MWQEQKIKGSSVRDEVGEALRQLGSSIHLISMTRFSFGDLLWLLVWRM